MNASVSASASAAAAATAATAASAAAAAAAPAAHAGPARAIVTGSSSGIGAAVVRRLLAEDWWVEGLDCAAPCVQHERFAAHRLDLTDVARCNQLVAKLLAGGTPQALVHAAGVLRTGGLGQLDIDEGVLMWQLHVQSATVLANRVLPAMRRQHAGRVVFIGSRIWRGIAGRSQYAASKAALLSLARSWAAEVVADGITVNVVSPAATDTRMLKDPARAALAPQLPPIGRLIQADEVAALVGFLLSPHAAAITGQDIAICGGASLPR